MGCDDYQQTTADLNALFQSTHPSGVRLARRVSDRHRLNGFQSTHPSGVRLVDRRIRVVRGVISIHAPQWGATRLPSPWNPVVGHFNPRTPVGCDRPDNTSLRGGAYFNPRTPVGCDFMRWRCFSFVCSFQSTHPSGVRLEIERHPRILAKFQSTHPSGVRHMRWASLLSTSLFQSTHPSGVRHAIRISARKILNISIHAPQWGATRHYCCRCLCQMISIHAPQWGATYLTGGVDKSPR